MVREPRTVLTRNPHDADAAEQDAQGTGWRSRYRAELGARGRRSGRGTEGGNEAEEELEEVLRATDLETRLTHLLRTTVRLKHCFEVRIVS